MGGKSQVGEFDTRRAFLRGAAGFGLVGLAVLVYCIDVSTPVVLRPWWLAFVGTFALWLIPNTYNTSRDYLNLRERTAPRWALRTLWIVCYPGVVCLWVPGLTYVGQKVATQQGARVEARSAGQETRSTLGRPGDPHHRAESWTVRGYTYTTREGTEHYLETTSAGDTVLYHPGDPTLATLRASFAEPWVLWAFRLGCVLTGWFAFSHWINEELPFGFEPLPSPEEESEEPDAATSAEEEA